MLKMWLKCNLRSKVEYGCRRADFHESNFCPTALHGDHPYGDAHSESISVSSTTVNQCQQYDSQALSAVRLPFYRFFVKQKRTGRLYKLVRFSR
jgi:hypothetical protein